MKSFNEWVTDAEKAELEQYGINDVVIYSVGETYKVYAIDGEKFLGEYQAEELMEVWGPDWTSALVK